MIKSCDKVLIALSGGKDSVALFFFLTKYLSKLKIKLFAVHVNHMLRGEDADKDQAFCEDLCKQHNVKLFVKKIDVKSIAKLNSKSVEEAAREIRYQYFKEICDEYNIDKIATAHTASDNTETVIYNISRGSGTKGICGIPPIRDNIIRPLIFCTKEDTEEYCISNSVSFCTDKTNFENCYQRNNIRLNVIPQLKKRNSSIDNSVSKLSYIARCDRKLIEHIASEFVNKFDYALPLEETAQLFEDEKMLSCAHEILCIKSGIIVPFDIFMQCRSVIISRKTGKRVKIAADVYLVIDYDKIKFEKERQSFEYCEIPLTLNKTIKFANATQITLLRQKEAINYKNINNLTKKATLNFGTIYGDIFVRKKLDGDSYIAGGMTRSVKKFFSDNKISRGARDCYPIICDSKGIIWVPGMQICDRAVPKNNDDKNITIIVEFFYE